jgi:hypothetical protein
MSTGCRARRTPPGYGSYARWAMEREVFVTSNRNFTEALLAGLSLTHDHGRTPVVRERVVECEDGEARYYVHFTVPNDEDPLDEDEPE